MYKKCVTVLLVPKPSDCWHVDMDLVTSLSYSFGFLSKEYYHVYLKRKLLLLSLSVCRCPAPTLLSHLCIPLTSHM